MVKEIQSLDEFERETAGPGLVVVDFFTTWCGPCKAIAPVLESLAAKYPDVKFIKVDIEKNEDIAAPRHIQSIPTFHFVVKGRLVDELKGANAGAIEQKVQQHKVDVNPFKGEGNRLSNGPSDPHVPALSAREARLKAFAAMEGERKAPAPKQEAPVQKQSAGAAHDDEEEALAQAMSLSLADGSAQGPSGAGAKKGPTAAPETAAKTSAQDEADFAAAAAEFDAQEAAKSAPQHFQEAPGQTWDEEMVPVPVNEELLNQLLEMGFSDVRARKGLVHGGSIDGAMAWLGEHQDDADIDQPYMVRKADTLPKPPLTEEEKAARLQAIKDKMAQRKADRAKQERAEEIKREKERRERGQKMDETLEERQRLMRKREAEKAKREKEEQAKERLRLRAEIAADKERRRANNGVLPSVLGVDGYNPSIIQYDVPADKAESKATVPAKRTSEPSPSAGPAAAASASATAAPAPKSAPPAKKATTSASTASGNNAAASNASPEERVDSAIQTLMRYRTGGDGGAALKLLLTFVRNVADNPTELKYQSINTESAAFKSKLQPLVGPLTLLKAVGFQKGEGEDEGKLKFDGDPTSSLLRETVTKLTNAEALYRQQNPV